VKRRAVNIRHTNYIHLSKLLSYSSTRPIHTAEQCMFITLQHVQYSSFLITIASAFFIVK
jgi:hypothetical protein